jgi:hypothetical protein
MGESPVASVGRSWFKGAQGRPGRAPGSGSGSDWIVPPSSGTVLILWTTSGRPRILRGAGGRPDAATVGTARMSAYTRRMMRFGRLAALALAAVFTAACSQPLAVDTIQLGRSLNADQSIASQTTTFKPNETVYVSALNNARGQGTVKVRWMMGSQLLSEREKTVKFPGAGATEFNISSATGFPEGDYTVEVFVDGVSVGTRKFNVSK